MEMNEIVLELNVRIAILHLDDETAKKVIDLIFWAMEETAKMKLSQPLYSNKIVPDDECKQSKCANTTTGCVGYCKLDEITKGLSVTMPPP